MGEDSCAPMPRRIERKKLARVAEAKKARYQFQNLDPEGSNRGPLNAGFVRLELYL
jgi:hypothetical protein